MFIRKYSAKWRSLILRKRDTHRNLFTEFFPLIESIDIIARCELSWTNIRNLESEKMPKNKTGLQVDMWAFPNRVSNLNWILIVFHYKILTQLNFIYRKFILIPYEISSGKEMTLIVFYWVFEYTKITSAKCNQCNDLSLSCLCMLHACVNERHQIIIIKDLPNY